jgi:hypothetical protein
MNHGRRRANQRPILAIGQLRPIVTVLSCTNHCVLLGRSIPSQPSTVTNPANHNQAPTFPTPPGCQLRRRRLAGRVRTRSLHLHCMPKGFDKMMHLGNMALILHVLIEVPASLSFLLAAPKQLRDPRPSLEAVLVCQSYGGLLAATNVLCLLLLYCRGIAAFDDASAIIAASLAIYHVMPMRRAWVRIKAQRAGRGWLRQADVLGGPFVHFAVHALLLVSLTWAGLQGLVPGKP